MVAPPESADRISAHSKHLSVSSATLSSGDPGGEPKEEKADPIANDH
jgi:hypothetical protein